MVNEISAWSADDGSIHASKLAAVEHDARLQLRKLDTFNEASINAVINQAKAVVDALQPVMWEREAKNLTTEGNNANAH